MTDIPIPESTVALACTLARKWKEKGGTPERAYELAGVKPGDDPYLDHVIKEVWGDDDDSDVPTAARP